MSRQDADRFLDLAEGDAALAERLSALEGPATEVLPKAVALGAERGFSFTGDEFAAAARARTPDVELSDEELDGVAGGAGGGHGSIRIRVRVRGGHGGGGGWTGSTGVRG